MSAADDVKKAWTDKGTHPEYHRMSQRQLHQQWPVLARAIEKLVREPVSTEAITDEPKRGGNGPQPRLVNGRPVIDAHLTAGRMYLADNGSGWWKVEAMPPSRKERISDILLVEHHRGNIKGCACGWGNDGTKLGQSHSEHVADVILKELGL